MVQFLWITWQVDQYIFFVVCSEISAMDCVTLQISEHGMVRTGLEKSLKNGTVLENSFNFEISAFVLQKLLENLQMSLNIKKFAWIKALCSILKSYPNFYFLFFAKKVKSK